MQRNTAVFRSSWLSFLLAGSVLLGGCGSETPVDPGTLDPGDAGPGASSSGEPPREEGVLDGTTGVAFGADVPEAVRTRVLAHLRAVEPTVQAIDAEREPILRNGARWLSIGDTMASRSLAGEPAALGEEGYRIKGEAVEGGHRLVAFGTSARGNGYAAYALMEQLGFAFLHPLAPHRPTALGAIAVADATRTPRWHDREIHLHTQHPLELTELLQGWGSQGPTDRAGFEAMLPEWDAYLEWLLANGQNGVEWFLLYADSWKEFADSDERFDRLRLLVDRTHDFALRAGIDVPIVFGQQHAYRLVRQQGELDAELAELRQRVDAVMSAGWDFLGTESGTSEFTSPDPERMLTWMNELTRHADERWHVPVFIKVHASTGQVAEGYPDPVTGEDINFNFLPHHADPRLGVLPHTVQHYGLDDPAPTYGNTDFGYMRDFIRQEAGIRPTVWYPETAYWVSFDVDVPLFLPVYAERRLSDLRLIASDEDQGRMQKPGAHMDGQLIFSSGWEWGYWLNDVVAARAAWDPGQGLSDTEALRVAFAPVVRPFGDAADEVRVWLTDTVAADRALLIEGRVNGVRPSDILKRNGQGYLQGWESWDDVSKLTTALPPTQPDRLGLVNMRNPVHSPNYKSEIEPLLAEMETTFGALADRGDALRARIPAEARDLFDDLADAARMTALRATQIRGLYRYVDGYWPGSTQATRYQDLARARQALDTAQELATAREARYRVPAERIAGWRPENPTAYAFSYLWTVRSLYFWWRDEGKAVDVPKLPCYLNIINPVDVAFGEGMGTDAARFFGQYLDSGDQRSCLAEPTSEPRFPQNDLRSRPTP